MATETQTDPATQGLSTFQEQMLAALGELEQSGNHRHSIPHGLAIKDRLETYYDEEVHHGRLYPNLDTLDHKGLIEKSDIDDRTRGYTLTEQGRQYLIAMGERLLAAAPDNGVTDA